MSSAHPWNMEYTSLPPRPCIDVSSDGHHIGQWTKRESASFDTLERNLPLSVRDPLRSGSQCEELDTILPEQPMEAALNDCGWVIPIVDAVTETEILFQLLYGVQGLPTSAIRCEGKAAIGDRCIDPWVTLQSDCKQVDFVLD